MFIAWGRLSRRTEDLSKELGLESLFIYDRPPYIKAFIKTASVLWRKRPGIVFIQLPQGPLLAETIVLSMLLGFHVVADVHTGFIYTSTFKEALLNKPFHGYLRKASLIMAHNMLEQELIVERVGVSVEKTLVVYDPPPKPPQILVKPKIDIDFRNAIVLPSSWSPDEPIDKVVAEFLRSRALNDVALIITGSWWRNVGMYRRVKAIVDGFGKADKIVLTGFIPDEEYFYLLKSCRAVVVLTNREYTLPHTLWEAVVLGKLFIVSRTRAIERELGLGYPYMFKPDLSNFTNVLYRCLGEEGAEKALEISSKLKLKSIESISKLKEALQTLERV
jgi:glycosyltransferase involved in cell wall biosynthesis